MCSSIHLHIQQSASAVKKVFLAADLINVVRSNSLLSYFIYHLVMGFSTAGSQCHGRLYLWVTESALHFPGKTTDILISVYTVCLCVEGTLWSFFFIFLLLVALWCNVFYNNSMHRSMWQSDSHSCWWFYAILLSVHVTHQEM